MEKIKGVLVNTNSMMTTVEVIDKNLDSYYKLLNCDCVDIVRRTIDGTEMTIICDDEFFLKENEPKVSAIYTDNTIAFMGNIFVVSENENGDELTSLTDKEIRIVLNNIMKNGILTLNY